MVGFLSAVVKKLMMVFCVKIGCHLIRGLSRERLLLNAGGTLNHLGNSDTHLTHFGLLLSLL